MTMNLGTWITIVAVAMTTMPAVAESNAALRDQVWKSEVAFAKTMADRDHAKFTSFLADEAIFFGSKSVMRGKSAVAEKWKPFFEGAEPPFAWAPEKVEVLESGTLAMSSGPVTDPKTGERVGTFNSTWRREADGTWKIVLDIGCPPCECGEKK
jgi:ketosteroid isomerase-like protein